MKTNKPDTAATSGRVQRIVRFVVGMTVCFVCFTPGAVLLELSESDFWPRLILFWGGMIYYHFLDLPNGKDEL